MAVRNYDLSGHRSPRLSVLETAPLRRQDVRRSKQRYVVAGFLSVSVPFAAALIVLGVAH
jgi:hypothetical protein